MTDAPDGLSYRQTRPQAYRTKAAWIIFLGVLVLGLVVDLGSKRWAFRNVAPHPVTLQRSILIADETYNPIPLHDGIDVLPLRLLKFELVINRGAVFGLGANMRWFFVGFTLLAVTGGVYVFCRYIRPQDRMAQASLGLILAGGIGNLYDRVVFGAVRDFLKMLPDRHLPMGWRWPGGSPEIFPWVFNVADSMLLFGMALMMIHLHRLDRIQLVQSKDQASQSAS